MPSNLDRFKKDLERLLKMGADLGMAMDVECFPSETKGSFKKKYGESGASILKALPKFNHAYQI